MTAGSFPPISPAVQALGYAVVLSIWSSTLLALCAWAFSKTRRGASPASRHWTAFGALIGSTGFAAVTWWVLAHPHALAALPTAIATDTGSAIQTAVPGGVSRVLFQQGTAGTIQTRTTLWATWVALAWVAIVSLLLVRFALAVVSSWWIRRRATPLRSGAVADAAKRLAERLGCPRTIVVVESSQIEYPAATGWRRPSLIVPCGLDISLPPQHLDPVIAHELEHLRGGDPRIATIQALVDAFLFFSPGVRWLSRVAREAREQRCDDVAVRTCGDPKAYATALGVLATRASGSWLTAVMGVQAPSLANRIKRILTGESMSRMNRVQASALFVAVVATIGSGAAVLAISLEGMRDAGTLRVEVSQTPGSSVVKGVPTGFLMTQHGAPLRISAATGDGNYCFTHVTVRNVSEKPVASATFAAVVEYPEPLQPSIAVKADGIPVVLDPGAAAEIPLTLLPVADVLQWKASRGIRAQAVIGLLEVVFADGDRWAITPPPNAASHQEYFLLPVAEVSRSMIASPDGSKGPGRLCRDDRGLEYSPGAVVKIRGEAGTAVCRDGVWEERVSTPRPAVAGEQEDLRLEFEVVKDGTVVARPQVKGRAGQTMTITLDQEKIALTLVPTRLDAHEVRVDFDTKVGSVGGKTAVVLRDYEVSRATIPGAPSGFELRLALNR